MYTYTYMKYVKLLVVISEWHSSEWFLWIFQVFCDKHINKYFFFLFLVTLPSKGERKMDLNFCSINIGFNLITDTVISQMCEPNVNTLTWPPLHQSWLKELGSKLPEKRTDTVSLLLRAERQGLKATSFQVGASLVAQLVKNLPARQETWVRSLGREDSLEKGKATHSSILAWRISMNRGAWWATLLGVTKSHTR